MILTVVAKLWWSADPVYVWNRYSVYYPTYYDVIKWSGVISGAVNGCAARRDPICENYVINSDGSFTLSGEVSTRYNPGTFYITDYTTNSNESVIKSVTGEAGTYPAGTPLYSVYLHSTSFAVSSISEAKIGQVTGAAQQGSYIDQVTSLSRSAYPDNAQSGDYWYVYQKQI